MILQVVKEGHPKLRKVCGKANPSLAHHKTLAFRLLETMKSHKALGIAANQVFPGELVGIIAVNTSKFRGVMFNPEIVSMSGVSCLSEGCLSLKDERRIFRAKNITVQFQTGTPVLRTMEFSDLDAVIVQHEIDHLNGILATDYDPKVDLQE